MKKFISWTAVILWMGLIFYLSSQLATESSKLSRGVTDVLLESVEKIAPDSKLHISDYNHIVRKNAHFFVYLVLGVLVINALDRRKKRSMLLAIGICILYAISDEFHQLFVPGRGAQVKDVFIDSAGACIGIVVYNLISRRIEGQGPRSSYYN
ncbi:VanZ family protein [Bacillus mesophilus]|uniref:VanZ family protein n=1 Tax=Bacillus mesophilus TaxID=1808955 RepID=A0A6M0Q7M3_9BACI|nr:VanZ family protein [Bacillus mesophilus]MBM7661670.1 VanZ family protein [Bacillus mesophilus]NEY72332.1 VanZ family protein [Bacillus mesophilus]